MRAKRVAGNHNYNILKAISYSLILFLLVFAHTASAGGVQWLSTQFTNQSGYTSAACVATATQSTSETLRTFAELEIEGSSDTAAALTFLNASDDSNTELLARKIIANVDAGNDVSLLIGELLTHKNNQGEFGDQPGYNSTAFDTALTLTALNKAGFADNQVIGFAAGYLLNEQNIDGGWSLENNDSSVYLTSLVVEALLPYKSVFVDVPAALANAQTFILNQRNANGLWDEVFESALSIIAISRNAQDTVLVDNSIAALKNLQQTNGSWGDDAYQTALALRAVNIEDNLPINAATAQISGTVIDSLTGSVLNGASINLSGAGSATANSDATGQFSFNDLVPGNYSLQVSLQDYATVTVSVIAPAGQEIDTGSIPLTRAQSATTGIVRGTITDGTSGLSGVVVTAGSFSAITDASGNYQINNVDPGSVNLEAVKTGFSTAMASGNITAGGILVFSTALSQNQSGTNTITGTVTDGSTNSPLSGATVSVTGSTTAFTTTDTQGNYEITNLSSGTINVEVSQAGFDSVTGSATIATNTVINFSPQLFPLNTTPPGANTAGITGVVVNAGNNQPLENVDIQVTTNSGTQSVTTNASGQFNVSGLIDADATLTFTLAGFNAITTTVPLQILTVTNVGQIRLAPEQAQILLPDLIPEIINTNSAITNTDSLQVIGDVSVTIRNIGTLSASSGISVLAFYDTNKDDVYDSSDVQLGVITTQNELQVSDSETVTIPVNGQLPFRDAPIKVWVDSQQSIAEILETNNIISSADECCPLDITELTFEDFTVADCPANQTPFSPDRYLSSGVRLNSENGTDPVCHYQPTIPSVLEDPNGGLASVPYGLVGNDANQPSIRATFVDPDTGLSSTVNYVRVIVISGDGPDLLTSDAALIAYDVNGNEIARHQANTSLTHETLIVNVPGIASVLMQSGFNANEGFDNFAFGNRNCDCVVAPQPNQNITIEPTLKYNNSVRAVASIPVVGPLIDTNGDSVIDENDNPFIVSIGTSDTVLAINGVTGITEWTGATTTAEGLSNLALGDVDADGVPEIIAFTGLNIAAFNNDGTTKWISSEQRTINGGSNGSSISLADIDNDGQSEIIGGDLVLNSDGTLKWRAVSINGSSFNTTAPMIADLDLDGNPEILIEGIAHRNDGSVYWQRPDVRSGQAGIANLDDDPFPEIVLNVGSYVAANGLYVLEHDGTTKWGPIDVGGFLNGGAPLIADVDNDGLLEIGVIGQSAYYLFNADGTPRWQVPHTDASTFTSASAFDLNADGIMEIFYRDQTTFRILNGLDGNAIFTSSNSSITASEYPIVADVDGDGAAEIVVPGSGGISVYENINDDWVGARKIWNQHAYHVTNVNDDGSIPAIEQNSWQANNTYRVNSVPVEVCEVEVPEVLPGFTVPEGYSIELFAENFDTLQAGIGGIASDSQGNIFVSNGDNTNTRVIKFPAGSNIPQNFGTIALFDLDGVAVDSQDNIIAAGRTEVVKFDPDGNIIWQVSCPVANQQLVTVDSDDNVYVGTQNPQICRISADGASVTTIGNFTFPSEILVGADDFLYIGEFTNGTFVKADKTTGAIVEIIATDVADIRQPILDSDNNILVGNGDAVSKINLSDNSISTFASGFDLARALTFTPDGSLYVGDQTESILYKISKVPTKGKLDLTASLLKVDSGNAGAGLTLSMRVGNAGTDSSPDNVNVSLYEGDPSDGGILVSTTTVSSIGASDFQDIQFTNVTGLAGNTDLFAVVDADDSVAECREDNNTVSIPGPDLIPDLQVDDIDTTNLVVDNATGDVSGILVATISNLATLDSSEVNQVIAFLDNNGNGIYDVGTDTLLGSVALSETVIIGGFVTVNIPIQGQLPYRDAPISVFVDSEMMVDEENETNNIASTADACIGDPPPAGVLDPVLKWQWNGPDQNSAARRVFGPVIVAQLNDDNSDGQINTSDVPDLIFTSGTRSNTSTNTYLNAISGDDGSQLWANNNFNFSHRSSVAVGDIDNDGLIEIIAVSRTRNSLYAFENDGTPKWQVQAGPVYTSGNWVSDGIAIADLDQDGQPEIINARRVYNADGSLKWEGTQDYGGHNTRSGEPRHWGHASLAANVDNSGEMEVVAGRTLYASDGSVVWHRSDIGNDGWNAIGNFDSDSFAEIVLVTDGEVYLLEHSGETIWGPITLASGGPGGPPTVADFDGDGQPEVGVAGATQYFVFETDGSLKWSINTNDTSSAATGSSVFDFEGDGKAEVLYADEDNFYIYDGTTGTVLTQIPNSSITTLEYTTIADVDNDGSAEIIVPSNDIGSLVSSGVRVYESASNSWAPTRSIWNQHTYHINNINDDGTIPQFEQPSWLSHNSYRLNTFADRNALSSPDLTTSRIQVIDNGAGNAVSIGARIGNAGAIASPTVTVSFYEGDPNVGGVLLGSTTVNSITSGMFTDVTLPNVTGYTGSTDIYVFADSDDQVNECDELNNIDSISGSVQMAASGVITAATDQAVYNPNSVVNLEGITTNNSAFPGNYTVELLILDSAGALVEQVLAPTAINALASGANLTTTEVWNSFGFVAGTYTLQSILRTTDGLELSQDTAVFEIREPGGAGSTGTLRTTTDRQIYHTTDAVDIGNLVQNISVNTILEDTTVQVTVTNPSGQIVFTTVLTVGQLNANALRDLNSTFAFTDVVEGTYTVQGQLLDGDNNVLATDQVTYQVVEDLNATLTGVVDAQLPELFVGEQQTCTDTITNEGTLDLSGQQVRQLLVNISTQVQIDEVLSVINIPAGDSQTFIRNIDTSGLDAEDHACLLQTQINGVWETIAFDTFILNASPNTPPNANAGPDQTGFVGDTITLDGTGSNDPDFDPITYLWSFTQVPTDSAVALDDATSETPIFVVDKKGTYELQLIVNDGTVDSTADTITIIIGNVKPIANAGADQNVNVNDVVTLDGSASTDADGDALTYLWSIVNAPAGSTATLSDATAVMPTLSIDAQGSFTLQLIVNDGVVNSDADTVTLTVDNVIPVADAGADQTVNVNDTVTLDGSASSDADGDPLTYLWSIVTAPTGSTAALSDATAVMPTIVIDEQGQYELQLIVNDGIDNSVADTVVLNALNTKPIANAGPDQSVIVGETADLDGTASSDADGDPLTYSWSILSQPADSTATLINDTSETPSITIDRDGMYVIQLIVNDGIEDSDADTIVLNVANVRPIANAGADQGAATGSVVTLDGSLSNDPDNDPITYQWSLTSVPAGSAATLDDATSITPTFVADLEGMYIAQLIVNDGTLDSDPDTVVITVQTVNESPDCTNAAADPDRLWPPNHKYQTIGITGVTDPEGNGLTFNVFSITQDEPLNANGDGNTCPDARIVGNNIQVRRERQGGGNGRVYQINFEANDGQGGTCTGSIITGVPKSKKKGIQIVDDGQNYNSLGSCP